MSILINGMEMPKSCIWRDGKCPLLGDDDNCKLQDCQEDWTWEDQYKGCPLSEAPEPCEDAVSRQAAIDTIDKALSRTFTEPCGEMILKDVPSAQSKKFSEVLQDMMDEDYYLFCHTGYSRLAEKDWEWLIEQVKEMEQKGGKNDS